MNKEMARELFEDLTLDQITEPWDVYNYYVYKVWLDCDADDDLLEYAFAAGLEGKEYPDESVAETYAGYTDMDYVESINKIARDIHAKGLQVFIDDALKEACKKETLNESADLRIQYPADGVKLEMHSDDAADLVSFARAILGDNYDCFDCDFAEVMVPEDAELEDAPAPVFMGIDLAEPIRADEPYVDPFEQDIFASEASTQEETPVVNEVPEFAEVPEVPAEPAADVAAEVTSEVSEEEAAEAAEVTADEPAVEDPTVVEEDPVEEPAEDPVEEPVEEKSEEEAIADNLSAAKAEVEAEAVVDDTEGEDSLEEEFDDFATQVQSDELVNPAADVRKYYCLVDGEVVGEVYAESEEAAYIEMEVQYPDLPYSYADGQCTVELAEAVEEDDMSDEAFVEAVGKMIVDNRKNK